MKIIDVTLNPRFPGNQAVRDALYSTASTIQQEQPELVDASFAATAADDGPDQDAPTVLAAAAADEASTAARRAYADLWMAVYEQFTADLGETRYGSRELQDFEISIRI